MIYDTENKEKVIRRMIQLGIDFFRFHFLNTKDLKVRKSVDLLIMWQGA